MPLMFLESPAKSERCKWLQGLGCQRKSKVVNVTMCASCTMYAFFVTMCVCIFNVTMCALLMLQCVPHSCTLYASYLICLIHAVLSGLPSEASMLIITHNLLLVTHHITKNIAQRGTFVVFDLFANHTKCSSRRYIRRFWYHTKSHKS